MLNVGQHCGLNVHNLLHQRLANCWQIHFKRWTVEGTMFHGELCLAKSPSQVAIVISSYNGVPVFQHSENTLVTSLEHQRLNLIACYPRLMNHGLLIRGYSPYFVMIWYFFMVPSHFSTAVSLGFIHPGFTKFHGPLLWLAPYGPWLGWRWLDVRPLPSGKQLAIEAMASRNSWFTQLQNGGSFQFNSSLCKPLPGRVTWPKSPRKKSVGLVAHSWPQIFFFFLISERGSARKSASSIDIRHQLPSGKRVHN